MDGWMSCNFTSFSTVFQLYQDIGWMIMKRLCAMESCLPLRRYPPLYCLPTKFENKDSFTLQNWLWSKIFSNMHIVHTIIRQAIKFQRTQMKNIWRVKLHFIPRPKGSRDIAMSLASVRKSVRTSVRKNFWVCSITWKPFGIFRWYFTVL